jgi:hypothetical protein
MPHPSASSSSPRSPQQLDPGRPTALLFERSIGLVLALNTRRGQLYCCEIEAGRARLKWLSMARLPSCQVASLPRDLDSPTARAEAAHRGGVVTYLDSPEGLGRLPKAEGLSVVAYAALHGHTQRDLSSCQVASLSSIALAKGARGRVVDRAAAMIQTEAAETQSTLRAVAAQHVEDKGQTFEWRGLSLAELGAVARQLGLHVRGVETPKADAAALEAFRTAARAHLGRVIVNFARPALEQQGSGHHSVLVAYHRPTDAFLVDDPAGFKVPPFWVGAQRLLEAMATFDGTQGVQRHRGYVLVEREAEEGEDEDMSNSIQLRPSTPRS